MNFTTILKLLHFFFCCDMIKVKEVKSNIEQTKELFLTFPSFHFYFIPARGAWASVILHRSNVFYKKS